MKKPLYIIIMLLSFAVSCKNRQIAINKSQLSDKSILTDVKHINVITTDTGKQDLETIVVKNFQDSAEVKIIPDSGTIQSIHIASNASFDYTGKAKYISYKAGITQKELMNKTLQQTNGLNTQIISVDSISNSKNIIQDIRNKTTTAKADHSWIITLIIVMCIMCFLAYLLFKSKIRLIL